MSNSLPERIRVFIVRSPVTGRIHFVTFDAGEAVRIKSEFLRVGLQVDLEEQVATRGFQSTGVIEFRCLPCPSHHLISAEAVDGPSEIHDGCCDAASARAARERQESSFEPWWMQAALKRGIEIGTAKQCEDHDWEDVEIQHVADETPTQFNPFSGAIRYSVTKSETVAQRCKKCPAQQTIERDCNCKPETPCRCVGPCRC